MTPTAPSTELLGGLIVVTPLTESPTQQTVNRRLVFGLFNVLVPLVLSACEHVIYYDSFWHTLALSLAFAAGSVVVGSLLEQFQDQLRLTARRRVLCLVLASTVFFLWGEYVSFDRVEIIPAFMVYLVSLLATEVTEECNWDIRWCSGMSTGSSARKVVVLVDLNCCPFWSVTTFVVLFTRELRENNGTGGAHAPPVLFCVPSVF